jgi:hypothetical protein
MTDTPENIKALQLRIWLSKSPMERLRQMMADNEALMKFWSVTYRTDESPELISGNDNALQEANKE